MDRPTLDRALASASGQTWPNLEIVVAAACGDRHRLLPDTIGGRATRLVSAPGGAALDRPRAANLLLDAAQGDWLNFLDDDDEFLPDHVATLLTAPRRADERVLYSQATVRDEMGRDIGSCGRGGFHAQLRYQNRGLVMATMFHRSLLDEGVRFDPAFPVYEDRDFMIQCAIRSPFRYVDARTCIWYAHEGESGLGHGPNDNPELQQVHLPRLERKWRAQFDAWETAPEAQIFLGQHKLKHGTPAQALPHLEDALRRRPDDVNALNMCGVAYLRLGQLAQAERLMLRALELVPGHPALTDNLRLIRDGLARN